MGSARLLIRKNDRIVFFGDSITEQMLYTNYVESYLSARYPALNLSFFNAGWGGDTACGALARMDRDVLALKPTLVTLCFGMNDGRYTHPSDEIRKDFVRGMTGLVDRFRKAGVRLVMLTPGYVDEQASSNLAAVQYNSRGVRIMADEVLRLARRERLPVFDIHTLMNEVDRRGKAVDPRFCMAPDGVHPTPAGHLVMAYGLLKALGVPPLTERVVLDAARLRVRASAGVSLEGVRAIDGGVAVDLALEHVPFYVEPAARSVLPFLPFQDTFNRLTVQVRGLDHPWVSLRCGWMQSAATEREALEEGVNLFSLWAARPMQMAERIYRYTYEKDLIYKQAWRALGLDGQNTAYYNKRAHHALVRACPAIDAARAHLLGPETRRCTVEISGAELPVESIGCGDVIAYWRLLGPIHAPFRTDALGGEAAFSRSVSPLGHEWARVHCSPGRSEINLLQAFGPAQNCFAYAVAVLTSPVEQDAVLKLGSDDGAAAWFNGDLLLDKAETLRALTLDEDVVPCRLRRGENVLLVKITQATGGWAFAVRVDGLRTPVTARV